MLSCVALHCCSVLCCVVLCCAVLYDRAVLCSAVLLGCTTIMVMYDRYRCIFVLCVGVLPSEVLYVHNDHGRDLKPVFHPIREKKRFQCTEWRRFDNSGTPGPVPHETAVLPVPSTAVALQCAARRRT